MQRMLLRICSSLGLAVTMVAFSGCAKHAAAPRDAATATPTASPAATNYAALRVALLQALSQDAKNRGVPWAHPIKDIDWSAAGIVIVEKTNATKSVGDDCRLAIAASTDANQKLTDHLYRQQNDRNYDPKATPVWPVRVENANGALMVRYDPNAESGPTC